MAINVFSNGSTAAKTAKAFLHDISYAAGFRSTDQRQNGNVQIDSKLLPAATAVCKEVVDRAFNDVDAEIRQLTYFSFKANLTGPNAKYVAYTEEDIAKALVYLAECLNVYWDDLNATKHEKETFSKTILGRAVQAYERFTSNINTTQTVAQVPTSNTGIKNSAPKQSSPRVPGQPKNPYKSSGPQSSNVRDLQGAPGKKVYSETGEIYRIIGDHSASKNRPNAFIRPLKSSGAAGNTNKVFFNSGNGYEDCTCWFETQADAVNFLNQIKANTKIDPAISNIRVAGPSKPDTNGYFLVGTEFGPCAIQASKLNEMLQETLDEVAEADKSCWDKVCENYDEDSKQELKYFMRKG